jgi:hypothetical protein
MVISPANVSTNAPVAGDVYAAGFSVRLGSTVGADLTAFANNVTVASGATIAGNARLAGESVVVSAPISGSALITARHLTLDAPIAGDLNFFGENISFGPAAKVSGKVIIQAPNEIAVPVEVASADRVTFTQLVNPDYVGEAGKTAGNVVNSFWPAVWGAAIWWLALLLIGAALIALLPRRLHALEVVSQKRPFRTIGLGILTFSSVVGLVIVAALTIVGLVVEPLIILFAVVACSVAYLAGAYLATLRVAVAFARIDSNLKRLAVLAVALLAAALLGMIPVLGWLITLTIIAFGFGVIAVVTMVRWSAGDATRLRAADISTSPTAPAAS